MTKRLLFSSAVLWLGFAATPRPQTGTFVGNITPICNATTGVCTLPDTPRSGTLMFHIDGICMKQAEDYTISGNTVTPVPLNVDRFADATAVKVAFYVKN